MTVEIDLQQQRVAHLDLTSFATVKTGTKVRQALVRMRRSRVSAILVQNEGNHLIGIFTERDVLLKVADNPSALDQVVDDLMTADPQTVMPDTSVGRALPADERRRLPKRPGSRQIRRRDRQSVATGDDNVSDRPFSPGDLQLAPRPRDDSDNPGRCVR